MRGVQGQDCESAMTQIKNGYLFLERRAPAPCEQCGDVIDLRPYGPDGASICAACGAKDPETHSRMMQYLNDLLQRAPNGVIFQDPNSRN